MSRKKSVISKCLSIVFIFAIMVSSISSIFTASAAGTATTIVEIGGSGRVYLNYSTLTNPKSIYTALQREIAVGTDLTLTADEAYAGDSFMYWYDMSSKKVLSYDKTFNITLISAINIRAEFASANDGSYIARYVNNAGILVGGFEVTTGTKVTAPSGPALPGFTFLNWDKTPDSFRNCTDYVIVKPVYQAIAINYNVSVTNSTGCSGAGSYAAYTVAKVSAAATDGSGNAFSYWKDATTNEIVSYYRGYSFYINKSVSLTAVYGETLTGDAVAVRITNVIADTNTRKITFYAERSVSSEFEIVKHGIILSKANYIVEDETAFVIGADSSVILTGSGKSFERVGTYSLTKSNVASGDTWYARAYVVYRNSSGVLTTAYSSVSEGYTV